MRVALVMAGDEEGGLEKHVVELANGLTRRGLLVSVIAHRKYRDRFCSKIDVHPVDLTAGRRNPIALWHLWRALRSTRGDVIHAHGGKAASMVATLLPLLHQHSVATLHGSKKNVRMFRRFERVIAVSKIAAQNLDHPNIRIVHNGLQPDLTRPPSANDAWDASDSQPRVLAAGRLVPVKGFDILISAWSGLNAQLCIAGDGPEREHLQALIDARGLGRHVKLLGHRDDMASLLSASELFVISSRYEGGPYTLVEALQAQVPVISTRVGAAPEILCDDMLCAAGDAKALADLIHLAIADLENLKARYSEIFEYAHHELTFERLLDRTIAVYSELAQ